MVSGSALTDCTKQGAVGFGVLANSEDRDYYYGDPTWDSALTLWNYIQCPQQHYSTSDLVMLS